MLILCVKNYELKILSQKTLRSGRKEGWMDGNFEVALNDELGLEPG